MYEAKRHGKARFEVFNEAMRTEALERLETESDLRHALERRQFVPYYQPVVELETHAVVGVEALARWRHPTRGLLAPREFIPICEETGLIVALGRFMLERACSEVERLGLRSRSDIPLKLWVNLSARQLAEPDLVATVAQALTAAGRGPSTICLEITESSLMSDFERSLANLESLAELNVGIGLDDFGQGYSSLSYLKQLPVDTLKIDRSFVSGVGSDRRDTAMVAAIVGLARTGSPDRSRGRRDPASARRAPTPRLRSGPGLPVRAAAARGGRGGASRARPPGPSAHLGPGGASPIGGRRGAHGRAASSWPASESSKSSRP
jgi:EAL domain-containing protein (putative c-di-GMP-specific phosphodiesterase class I)